uniref:DUF4371 domain-containing protein n=1 Tax=Kalanchoe fedtschenkoi TaxID=63787 RepID=A0A7N0RHX7_KALFE
MYKYYKRKTPKPHTSMNVMNSLTIDKTHVDLENLHADPGLRRKITQYHPNIRDEVRRAYILKGSCQLVKHKFSQRDIGGTNIEKDVVFYLCCYIFRSDTENWNKQDRLDMHARGSASLLFCGHDESESSSNKGNFIEVLKFLADHNESIGNVVLQNAPANFKLIAPNIQKDISNVAAQEVVYIIIKDIDGDYFVILIDEPHDVLIKEQMVVACMSRTTSLSLKRGLDSLFTKYNLTMSRVRGQDYDGANILCDEHANIIRKAMEEGELGTVRGSNHETNLKKALDTRWQSHYGVLLNLMDLFPSIINLLDAICESGAISEHRVQVNDLLKKL